MEIGMIRLGRMGGLPMSDKHTAARETHNTAMKVAELCAGYGGLAMGLDVDYEIGWYSELETVDGRPNPVAPLLNIRTGAPNLGDLTKITECPPVDIVTAGFPCQPFSHAGLRKGIDDERWLIDDVCRVARLAEARWLILENVAGILTANDGDAMGHVCAAMAREGFSRWEWRTIRASDVGACHQRKRWFCVARNAESIGWDAEPFTRSGQHWGSAGTTGRSDSDSGSRRVALLPTPTASDSVGSGSAGYSTDSGRHSGTTLTDALVRNLGREGIRDDGSDQTLRDVRGRVEAKEIQRPVGRPSPFPNSQELQRQHETSRPTYPLGASLSGEETLEGPVRRLWCGAEVDDSSSGQRLEKQRTVESCDSMHEVSHNEALARRLAQHEPAVQAWGKYCEAVARHAVILGRMPPSPATEGSLNPRAVEWMMMLPEGWVTDIVTSRAKALHVLGNGVVPLQAAAAIRSLSDE